MSKKIKKFKIKYYFDGNGEIEVDAKNEEEARDKFIDGDCDYKTENEWGESYIIDKVEEI